MTTQMKMITIAHRVETFNWTSEDNKIFISFTVTRMLEEIRAGRLKVDHVTTEISETFVTTWLSRRELNETYLRTLSRERIDDPVLGVWMDDKVLLIDGGHRYFRRYQLGLKTIDYYLIAETDWRRFATETRLTET